MVMIMIAGIMYEMIGRKITLSIFVILLSVSTILFPLCAPNMVGFEIARSLLSMF